MQGLIYVISAPSGCGKTTLVRSLLQTRSDLAHSISHTTRKPRSNEIDGVSYHFVLEDTFEAMVKAGEFVEHAHVFGNRYGTSRKSLIATLTDGQNVILEIDVQGAQQVKEQFKERAILCFVLPPSIDTLRNRLESRSQDAAEEIERRLNMVGKEVGAIESFDYVVINDDLQQATTELSTIISAAPFGLETQRKTHTALIDALKLMR